MGVTKPQGWKEHKLGSLGVFSKGQGIRKKEVKDSGLPCVRYGEIYTYYGTVVRDIKSFIDLETSKNSKKLDSGDILFAGSGETKEEIGKATVFLGTQETYAGGDIVIFSPQKVDPLFLGYLVNSPEIIKQKMRMGKGDAVVHISSRDLSDVELFIPENLIEQKVIAKALSDIDELISSLKLELKKKVLLLDALRCELIPNNFLNSNLPVGWEVKRLGDVGNITGAGVDKVIRAEDKFVHLVNYMDVYRNHFIDEEIAFMNTTATQAQIQNCDLIEGDVLFTPTSETPEDIAQSAVIKGNLKNCVYSYHLVRFRPKFAFNVEFLAHCFNLTDFKRQTLRAAEGSGTRYVITLPRFRNLEFPFPDLAEQERIGRCLSETAEEVSNTKMLLTKYLYVKQGMVNDLLTGKVRLE